MAHRGLALVAVAIFVLAGSSVVRADDPALVGQWSAVQNWPIVAVHAHLLPTGDVLAWSDYTDNGGAQVWRPSDNTFTAASFAAANLFCSAHTFLPDGRLLVAGGITGSVDDLGLQQSEIFDPDLGTWTQAGTMSMGRYYPATTRLPDGRVLVQGGTTACNSCIADTPEIFDPVTKVWTPMAPSARKTFKYYPHMYVLPDGRVLVAAQDDHAIGTQVLDLTTQTWTTIDADVYDGHSSVMYLPGKFMKAGTATQDNEGHSAAATTYVLDMTQPSPTWQATAWMQFPRSYLNLTVLPDGQVLATGGGMTTDKANFANAVKAAELWSPVSKTWTTMSAEQNPRLYHSTALLLPDARVLVAGGGRQSCTHPCPVPASGDQQNAEIFSPPYLFRGPRPVITTAPPVLQYGAAFTVVTPDASRIGSVALIALSSVTHAWNENQRFVPMTFEQNGGGLNVHPPANGNTAPPGPYMLFLVDTNGVPSIAWMVRVPPSGTDAQSPTPPGSLQASPAVGAVNLSWTASTDNIGVTGYELYRSTTSGFVPGVANRVGETTALSFSDQGMSSGTYYYLARAKDAAGNYSNPSNQAVATVTADTTPPGTTSGLAVLYAGPGKISLAWGAANDNVGVTGYRIERCLGSGCSSFVQVGTSSGTTFDNSGLAAGTTYQYRARAEDAHGNLGGYSSVVSATTSAASGGLVGAWGFNEGAGGTASDVSGYANNGTMSGATWSAQGKIGGGLAFSGTSAQLAVADSASLDLTTAMTLEAWVYPSSSSTGLRSILAKNTDRYYLMASSATQGRPAVGGTFGSGAQNVFGTQPLPVSAWTHVAATFDGASLRLYVNGASVAAASRSGALTTSTENLLIGNDVYGESFQGVLDEIRIYNRALSVSEIQADMSAPVETGPLQLTVARNSQSGSIVLSWTGAAPNGSYRVRRATGPSPAAFAAASCFAVAGTTFTDPAAAADGNSYDYLVDAGASCP
jgi:hypothetical protein